MKKNKRNLLMVIVNKKYVKRGSRRSRTDLLEEGPIATLNINIKKKILLYMPCK